MTEQYVVVDFSPAQRPAQELPVVEQQDLDTVQILLYQYTAEELDLNTPNSQGLTPLDIAIMTNNTPIAKLLLKAGGRESPHCELERCRVRRSW